MGETRGSGPGRICYHCKQHVAPGEDHNCWTTTEAALTSELPDDLRDAWERLRETAAELGEQRIYASHNSIMFARRTCYSFVRPKRSYLELCIFLGRTLESPRIRRVTRASASKLAHIIQIRHRDEVEAPLTDWLAEAYALQDAPRPNPAARKGAGKKKTGKASASKPVRKTGRSRPPAAESAMKRPRPKAASRTRKKRMGSKKR
jgi:hypothetical protein